MPATGPTPSALRSELLAPGMKVGLFGGSFDPVHEGHLHVARTALRRLGLDRVWWLVSPQNPLKSRASATLTCRLESVRALVGEPRMVVSDIEARLGINRTVDLVARLQASHPRVNFVWVMGADALAAFHTWYRWQEIAARLPMAIVARPQSPLRARLSPAARRYADYRLPERAAGMLAGTRPPCWTYLTEPLHEHTSTRLRQTPAASSC